MVQCLPETNEGPDFSKRSNPEDRALTLAVPGYQLMELAGEGGMGMVYRARQLSLDRVVAVKILHAAEGSTTSLPAFHRESRLLASLSHPHIVAIHDCGEHEGRYYLITEFVTGSPLRTAMFPGQPWPLDRAADTLDRIAQALIYIHNKGVLHLDLKPDNVLCTPDGNIKIADFGLALARMDARELCERGLAQGTIDYCAPEQRYGLHTSERSDLFSLAVMAYELLTGQLPGRIYQSAVQVNPRLPAALDRVLRRALERDAGARFENVAEFNRQLQATLRPKRYSRGRKLALAGFAASLLSLPFIWYAIAKPLTGLAASVAVDALRPRGWLLYDEPDSLSWFGSLGEGEASQEWADGLQRLRPTSLHPEGPDAPSLPEWPRPRPVMVLQMPDLTVFVHPLRNPRLAAWVGKHWKDLTAPIRPEDNMVRNGDFAEATDFHPEARDWRGPKPEDQQDGDSFRIEAPSDRPDNPALHLVKQNSSGQRNSLNVYQWLARTPDRTGDFAILRFRARAEHGDGRLLVEARVPLTIPRDDRSSVAERIRAISAPHPLMEPRPGIDTREYRSVNSVQPGTGWRTYLIVWDWPEYASEAWFRNIVITFSGLGEIWIDDIEMFAWEQEAAPEQPSEPRP